jgi:hypothetical protein
MSNLRGRDLGSFVVGFIALFGVANAEWRGPGEFRQAIAPGGCAVGDAAIAGPRRPLGTVLMTAFVGMILTTHSLAYRLDVVDFRSLTGH